MRGSRATCSPLIERGVVRHPRQQGVRAALAREGRRPEQRRVGEPELVRGELTHEPCLLLELTVELPGTPARVAGEDPGAPDAVLEVGQLAASRRQPDVAEDHK